MPFLADNNSTSEVLSIKYYSNFRYNFHYNLCVQFLGPGGAVGFGCFTVFKILPFPTFSKRSSEVQEIGC